MFTLSQVAKACGGKLVAQDPNHTISGVSCDSRTIQRDELFVALHGDRFDGHAFLSEAFQRKAVCALVDRGVGDSFPAIQVDDTLKAMHRLARFYRAWFSIPTIAITGSAGKTTTKECIAVLLSAVFKVHVGFGNWNNHIGVPLNIFKLSEQDQCFVLELGANHLGEISLLTHMAQPTVGVFTGIYPVHLEGFGSLNRIYDAKLELADYLERVSGTVIAYGDDPELLRRLRKKRVRLITFGKKPSCDYVMSDLAASDGSLCFRVNGVLNFRLGGYGSFNALNALAAIATAGYFNLDLKDLSESWQILPAIKGRFRVERYEAHDIQVVDDSYNANPKSFEQAIESFCELAAGRRKIAVVGDMLELGDSSRTYHEVLGRTLAEREIQTVLAVGPLSRYAIRTFLDGNHSGDARHFESPREANAFLVSVLREGDSILIKGSHGMQLGQVKPYLDEYLNKKENVSVS